MFGHLWRLWERWGPDAPAVDLRDDPVSVASFDGRSEAVSLRGRPVPGFVGRVAYEARAPDAIRIALDRCARLAPLAAIGAHTTTGFGVVRVS